MVSEHTNMLIYCTILLSGVTLFKPHLVSYVETAQILIHLPLEALHKDPANPSPGGDS